MNGVYAALAENEAPRSPLAPVCLIKLTADEIEERTRFRLKSLPEDGLGPRRGVVAKTPTGAVFAIEALHWVPASVTLHTNDASPNLGSEIRALLRWLGVTPEEVEWVVPYSRSSGFDVYRLDDNGNHSLVGNYASRAEAAFWVAEYEIRGHKQTYWFEECASHASRNAG